jgi:hypothetical protein
MARHLSSDAAAELARQLDLDVGDVGICHACLGFVSFPLRRGDERETARATADFAPSLWEEGLAGPARAALERARTAEVRCADAGSPMWRHEAAAA